MEPANLNPDSSPEADLETRLRAAIAGPALSDDGFSGRVLAALPEPKSRRPEQWIIPAAGALAGLIFVLARGASLTDLSAAVQQSAGLVAAADFALPLAVVLGIFAVLYAGEEPAAE